VNTLLISSAALGVPPDFYGGLEVIVYNLAKELSKRGHQIGIACPFESSLPSGVEHIQTISLRTHLGLENVAFSRYQERIKDFELVNDHSHTKVAYAYFKVNGGKFLSTLHSPQSVSYPMEKPNLVCLTKFHSGYVRKNQGLRSRVAYNGIDLSKYWWTSQKSDRFIFIGRPYEGKGVLDAIRFCKKLDVPIDIIAGSLESNPSLYAIQVAQQCDFLSKWSYHGTVPHEEKVKLLAKAKCFVFPLNWPEPFGITVIESLACGTPVIAYDKAGMSEIIKDGETGFLVKNEEEFLAAMKVIDRIDPKTCRRDAEKRWSDAKMTDRYEELYQEVMNGVRW